MAKPIKITILGDVQDLLGSLDNGAKGVEGFASKIGSAASSVAGTAAKFAVAGLAAAGIGNALSDSLDQAQLSSKLAAQLGGTVEQSKQYGETAGALYAQGYGESFAQVTEAVKSVVQNIQGMGNASGTELQKVGQMALNTAQIFDQDLGAVTRAVGQLMKTGLAANATEAFDIITTGLQNGTNKSDDLLDTFNEYGTQFRDLGLNGQQALGLLSQGLQAGARDSDIVADALKEFAIRAKDTATGTVEGFKAIGLNASEMARIFSEGGPKAASALDTVLDRLRSIQDPAERSRTAVKLFGTQAEDLQQALFALDPSSAVASLGNVAGAADRAGTSFHDNAASKLETFTRGLQAGFVEIVGGYVIPAIERLVTWFNDNLAPAFRVVGTFISSTLVPAFMAVAHWVQENGDWLSVVAAIITSVFVPALIAMGVRSTVELAKTIGLWVGTKLAALGSLAAQSGVIIGMIGRYIGLGVAAVAQAAVVAGGWILMGTQSLIQAARMAAAWVIAMGPVGWVIAAVVALVALIVANWDTIVQWTKQAWQWIVDAVVAAAQWVWDLFLNWTLPGLIIKHWDTIVAAVRAAVQWVLDAVAWLGELPGKVGAWFGRVYDGAVGKLGELVNWLRGLPQGVLNALGDFGSLLLNAGKDLLSGLWQGIQNAAAWLRDKIIGFFKSLLPDWVKDALGISSPSRVMASIGRWLPPGLAVGINDTASVAVQAATGLAADVTNAVAATSAAGPIEVAMPTLGTPDASRDRTRMYGASVPVAPTTYAPTVTVHVQSNADPDRIARDVAWALRNQGR